MDPAPPGGPVPAPAPVAGADRRAGAVAHGADRDALVPELRAAAARRGRAVYLDRFHQLLADPARPGVLAVAAAERDLRRHHGPADAHRRYPGRPAARATGPQDGHVRLLGRGPGLGHA